MARVLNVQVRPDATEPDSSAPVGQPYLHDLVTAVRAPGVALSGLDGQIHSAAHGAYWADRRVVSRLVVTADGSAPVAVRAAPISTGAVRFLGVLRHLGDTGPDPTVTLQRDREVVANGLVERVRMNSTAGEPVTTRIEIELGCDDADMNRVKAGHRGRALAPEPSPDGLRWRRSDRTEVRVRCTVAPFENTATGDGARLVWPVTIGVGESWEVTLQIETAGGPAPVVLPVRPDAAALAPPGFAVRSGDHRLAALVERSLADLAGLGLADPLDPNDRFLAAGAPWFLTLFGRDAIWAARMLLPLGTDVAAGTLRALARRQGSEVDVGSAQEPGKILHELRPTPTEDGLAHVQMRLPPLYYGTVDATALWISLLYDAWRWGLPEHEVAALLPAAERAAEWILRFGASKDGFVAYRDRSGRGLANQGWKDSFDSVQFSDGRLAEPPIALCEVQGYAYAAMRQAAHLSTVFGRGDRAEWLAWADGLQARFRDAFWIDDADGGYPAIAVDADGKPVDTVTSNIAHLLGTGLLDPAEEAAVVARITASDMDSGFGLRTMSANSAGFNPLGYHSGSVWTHDTAIAITGLAATDAAAAPAGIDRLCAGLLAAAPAFEFRMPELYGGFARTEYPVAVPYPAACRPQAWAATASIAVLTALLGLRADVPGGNLRLRPVRPSGVGAVEARGLRFGATPFDVAVDDTGDPTVSGLPPSVRVTVE
jgi:glycogen debranching enzyme